MIPEIRSTTDHLLAVYNSNSLKNENFNNKKRKKRLEIPSLYTSVPKIMIICYTVPDMARDRCHYSSFWANFCPLPSKQAKKPKVRKNNIIISHVCTKNYGQMKYGS